MNAERIAELRKAATAKDNNPGGTHWENCELHHHACTLSKLADAAERCAKLEALLREAESAITAALGIREALK